MRLYSKDFIICYICYDISKVDAHIVVMDRETEGERERARKRARDARRQRHSADSGM